MLKISHLSFSSDGWTDSGVDRKTGVSQISKRAPRRGDLILANWTSYVEVLYLAFRCVILVSESVRSEVCWLI